MGVSSGTQLIYFIHSVLGGFAVSFLFDLYRFMRILTRPKKLATYLEDFLFWMISTLILAVILYYSNNIELRGYEFLGFAAGAFLYFYTISRFVLKLLLYIFNISRRIFKTFVKLILYPMNLMLLLYKKIL